MTTFDGLLEAVDGFSHRKIWYDAWVVNIAFTYFTSSGHLDVVVTLTSFESLGRLKDVFILSYADDLSILAFSKDKRFAQNNQYQYCLLLLLNQGPDVTRYNHHTNLIASFLGLPDKEQLQKMIWPQTQTTYYTGAFEYGHLFMFI